MCESSLMIGVQSLGEGRKQVLSGYSYSVPNLQTETVRTHRFFVGGGESQVGRRGSIPLEQSQYRGLKTDSVF